MRYDNVGFLVALTGRIIHELSTAVAVAIVGPRGRSAHPVAAAFAIVFLGVLVGFLTTAFLPEPLFRTDAGMVATISATVVGMSIAMALLGAWVRKRGGEPSPIASFWGGGLFGAAIAVARLGMLMA